MANLKEVLLAEGHAESSQWGRLADPNISADGQWIIGRGINPQGDWETFLARLDTLESLGFVIHPMIADVWFNPATNGKGFLITVLAELRQLFRASFTYDFERPGEAVGDQFGEAGQRWLTAQGTYLGDTANRTLFLTSGGEFDSAHPPAMTDPSAYGTMTIEFADFSEAPIIYEIPALGLSGEIPI